LGSTNTSGKPGNTCLRNRHARLIGRRLMHLHRHVDETLGITVEAGRSGRSGDRCEWTERPISANGVTRLAA
jgi:hypothetical protein